MDFELLSQVPGTVLLTGQTGTGKSYKAKEIFVQSHYHSSQFIHVHTAAIPEALFESELFGHVKGAFTGAHETRQGLCDVIGGGTLFLDEIGEVSSEAQKKLLQLLEEKKFRPVGSNIEKQFKGRIIAATNKDLEQLVKKGDFREDLFHRLRVFNYHLPSWHELENEVKTKIIRDIAYSFSESGPFQNIKIERNFIMFLTDNIWRGNVREVRHIIEYTYYRGRGILTTEFLPSWAKGQDLEESNLESKLLEGCFGISSYHQALEIFESNFIKNTLQQNSGGVNKTAVAMGISKTTLIAKIRKYGINVNSIKYLHSVPA